MGLPAGAGSSRLVGRDADWTRLGHLAGAGGLVTLTGPGGVGKSRLASEFVSVHLDRTAEAVTVGLLAMVLADRKGFVLLDNCEHVIDAAREVANEINTAATSVVILATSREPLRLLDEQVMVLEPLGRTRRHR